MDISRVLVTGGAGFVGSNVACGLRQRLSDVEVLALDNLLRRGSELNIPRLQAAGVTFLHGDVRCPEDLADLPKFDLLIECSAEPSVHAGVAGSPAPVIRTNLDGAVNCLEAARRRRAAMLFLSTSRVYPVGAVNALEYREGDTRFELLERQSQPGCSGRGITEDFTLAGARSLYGATKLASELLIQEYGFMYDLRALIYRCGVLAGPWQMGRVDQGFVSLWVGRHHFGRPLRYIGFGGSGKQVRDVLHIDDLLDLIVLQLADPTLWDGRTYNVGGGVGVSTSLLELTTVCQTIMRRAVPTSSDSSTSPVDVPIYVSDYQKLERECGWHPRRSVEDIVVDTARWVRDHEDALRVVLP